MSGVKKKISASSFYVIDVEDPTAPVLEDTLSIGANPFSMAVSGNYAYVVDLVTGLEVIDLGLNHPLGIDPATGGMQRSHDHAAAWLNSPLRRNEQ